MALLVDRLSAVAEADAGNVLQMPPEVEEPALSYFPQVLRIPDGPIFLLNPEEILVRKPTAVSHDRSFPSRGLPETTASSESPMSDSARVERHPGGSSPIPVKPGRRPSRVLLSSLREETPDNNRLLVLFSPLQIEEILRNLQIHPVPFTPGYTEGIVDWRGRVLPVISLESRLGFKAKDRSKAAYSYAVVRMAAPSGNHARVHYGILKIGRSIRELKLPIDCRPISDSPMGIDPVLIRGFYEWKDGFLLVLHLEHILRRS